MTYLVITTYLSVKKNMRVAAMRRRRNEIFSRIL